MKKNVLIYPQRNTVKFKIFGMECRLFLEYIREYQHQQKCRLTFTVTTEPDPAEILEDYFIIKFDAIPAEGLKEFYNYIKSNTEQ